VFIYAHANLLRAASQVKVLLLVGRINPIFFKTNHIFLAGGNQRELARAKNQKKLQDAQRSKKGDKEPGAMTLEQRKHR
jgi:4F5 protein related disordered region